MECIPMIMQHQGNPGSLNFRYTDPPIDARIEEAAFEFALTLGALIL